MSVKVITQEDVDGLISDLTLDDMFSFQGLKVDDILPSGAVIKHILYHDPTDEIFFVVERDGKLYEVMFDDPLYRDQST